MPKATTYSRVGLRDVIFAKMLTDTNEGATYDAAQDLVESLTLDITPDGRDPDIQYADDKESDVMYGDPEIKASLEMKELPLSLKAWLLGNSIDANGVLVERAQDTPVYFAMGYKSVKRNGADRYGWLLKGRASPVTETHKTKEGKTVTRQTDKLEMTFIKRNVDGHVKTTVDSDTAAFASAKATFFDAPYAAVLPGEVVISAQPTDQYLAKSAGGTLAVTASLDPGTLAYKWYKATGKNYTSGVQSAYAGSATASLTIPTSIASGVHYFYCKLTGGAVDKYTDIAVVIIGA